MAHPWRCTGWRMMTVRRVRQAAVAGFFYPKSPEALREELGRFTATNASRVRSRGVIVPHASYHYSGSIVGETLSRLAIPRRCVILGPNHTGWGAPWSLMAEGAYATPLGEVPIDESCARALLEGCPLLTADDLAHRGEHAIEVELPFLQCLGPADLTIVPLVIGSEQPDEFDQVAGVLAEWISRTDEPVLLVASSDFTHYEPQTAAAHKDAQVIDAIQALDERGFLQRVRDLHVTMCGYGPVACVLGAARRLGASSAHLIRYATSADAGGDPQSVVGYAGLILN